MRILAGNSNVKLAQNIASNLGMELIKANIKHFADGEIFVEINEYVRGKDVCVLQSTSSPANDNLMELLVIIDALRRASARKIMVLLPYFGYARQDRKVVPRSPISAKLVANLVTTAGAHQAIILDLHAGQVQGFFDIPVDNIFALPVLIDNLQSNKEIKNPVVVSPDIGGVVRARTFAQKLGVDLAIIDKRREKPGSSEVMNIIGNVQGKDCILVDDIVDSGETLCNAAAALMENKANSVYAYVTHGILSGDACERIENSQLKNLIITDSIAQQNLNSSKIRIISVAPLLAEVIKRISGDISLANLYD